ncbi:protein NRT1/ PTR FAMILY 5.6-like isoform X1 [Prosopis cineraria]|uniref:protein NRT1/ PTR FAMILY 5.6-like isoform X1 n=2 Tax=Prosopis cineraria TaxID=364024 RepID=UPI00240EA641|nr:protein NRT1/ PTR FAMILY 5.6-like isoform X1 [Prosopis cineraria]
MEQEMDRTKRSTREETDPEKWVLDASVDHRGRFPLRASTGVWKATPFVLTIEFSERVSFFGIATNLITYLTKVIHQDLNTAAKNVNYWAGTTTLMPLIGGFVADAYTGRFYMVLFSSLVYLMGLSLLTMSQFVPSLMPCNNNTKVCGKPRKAHEVVFFLALYCISLGTGGYKPCLESFGADQFDDDHSEERKKKMSYFNWWNFALCFALLLGVTVVVYIQDYVGWGLACLCLTILMALTIIAFYVGRPFYRFRSPEGNTLTPILQVIVAAIRKRNLPGPSNPSVFYEVPKSQGRLLSHTNRLRCLDKAAIIEDKNEEQKDINPWRLTTLTRVEETKLILNMIPIWLTSLTNGICIAQSTTLFVKQADAMKLNITHSFKIPPASLAAAGALGTLISVPIYDRIIVPFLRKVKKNERGISILQRIGIGLAFSVLVMVVAALVETKRLGTVMSGSEKMSVFWLVPQYLLLGIGDSFSLVGLQEYFYDQVPDSMRSLGIGLFLSVIGAGSFLSSFLIIIVDHVTGKNGKSWIGKDINVSRLDRFYWLLTVLGALNFCVFVLLARRYTYKAVQRRIIVTDDGVEDKATRV